GIPERIGYSRDGRGIFLTMPVPFDKMARELHHSLYYLNLLRSVVLKPVYRHPWIYLNQEERLKAQTLLKGKERPVVIVNPGATYGSAKRWPPERFKALSERIVSELGGSVLISGSEREVPIAEEIKGALKEIEGVDVIAGRLTLREFIALLSQADAVVTNDSGPMHLAYAVGTPLVALFGSTSPEHTGPPSFVRAEESGFKKELEFSLKDRVIRKQLDCSPCFRRNCPEGEPKCLELIGVEEVSSALKEILPTRKAVFFDRDGTLCRDAHYLNRWEDLEVFPDIKELGKLKELGYLIVGITNQSGIARGIVDEDFVRQVNNYFIEKQGLDAFYYCPHHPDEHCACRKPSPGMLLRARAELGIDLKKSIVVGDKESDMELAKAVGCRGFFLRTGQERESKLADRGFNNLKELVQHIVSQRV
ncbi:MAG: lipopolysaccharide heptosyltransferase II, partial [Nitrospirae bacterium]